MIFLQRRLLFPGAVLDLTTIEVPKDVEIWWIEQKDCKTEAWYLKGTGEGKRPAVIFFHGNADYIESWYQRFDTVRAAGFDVLLVEYPGYRRSKGKPSEKSITAVALSAFDRLAKLDRIDLQSIVPMGVSLGSGAACIVATKRKTPALILQSPYTSVSAFASRYLLPSFIVLDKFDNYKNIAEFKNPILIFHGENDQVIPYHHSKKLLEIAQHARFIPQQCNHGDCPPNWQQYWVEILDFLGKALKQNR